MQKMLETIERRSGGNGKYVTVTVGTARSQAVEGQPEAEAAAMAEWREG
jgi:hypothetical protein